MPAYAEVRPDDDDWFLETSATEGMQAPLRSLTREGLVSAAFALGDGWAQHATDGFGWVSFRRWTPNAEYGMELHPETHQLCFTRFGVAVLRDWYEGFVPATAGGPAPPIARPAPAGEYRRVLDYMERFGLDEEGLLIRPTFLNAPSD